MTTNYPPQAMQPQPVLMDPRYNQFQQGMNNYGNPIQPRMNPMPNVQQPGVGPIPDPYN